MNMVKMLWSLHVPMVMLMLLVYWSEREQMWTSKLRYIEYGFAAINTMNVVRIIAKCLSARQLILLCISFCVCMNVCMTVTPRNAYFLYAVCAESSSWCMHAAAPLLSAVISAHVLKYNGSIYTTKTSNIKDERNALHSRVVATAWASQAMAWPMFSSKKPHT